MKAPVAVLLGVITTATVSAGQGSSARVSLDALLSARGLTCTFPWSTEVEWDRDEPRLRFIYQHFGFQIDRIDRQLGVARILGNARADDLIVLPGEDRLSFIEHTPGGSVNLTTVYAWLDSRGHFRAVHSRHTWVDRPAPSQNYGACESRE